MSQGKAAEEASFQSPASSPTLRASPGWRKVERDDKDPSRRGVQDDRRRRAVSAEGDESVPGGADDKEAHVVQRPPGAGLWPGPPRALGRRGLGLGVGLRLGLGLGLGLRGLRGLCGLHRLRGALATAQLSSHVLQDERPVRYGTGRTPPPPRQGPTLTSHRPSQRSGESQCRPPLPARLRSTVWKDWRCDATAHEPRPRTASEEGFRGGAQQTRPTHQQPATPARSPGAPPREQLGAAWSRPSYPSLSNPAPHPPKALKERAYRDWSELVLGT